MPYSKITVEQVELFLRAIHGGSVVANGLPEIDELFDPPVDSKEERTLVLADHLEAVVLKAYFSARSQVALPVHQPANKAGVLLQVKDDHPQGSVDLEAWSALYFRYFSPVSLPVEDLARAANVVP